MLAILQLWTVKCQFQEGGSESGVMELGNKREEVGVWGAQSMGTGDEPDGEEDEEGGADVGHEDRALR